MGEFKRHADDYLRKVREIGDWEVFEEFLCVCKEFFM